MLDYKLVSFFGIVLTLTWASAAVAAGGSLPLSGGSLPLHTAGHAVTLPGAGQETAELMTKITITEIGETAEIERLSCQGDMKAFSAKGTLQIGKETFSISALCFDAATHRISILGVRETGTALEEATVRATLDSSDANRRSLKGRLTIKDATTESRRFSMEAVEVITELTAPHE